MLTYCLTIATVAGLFSAGAHAAERNFAVGGFDRLAVEGSSDVVVTTGKAIGVRASGDDAALDRLDIRVERGVLRIGSKGSGWWRWNSGTTRITVTAPMLTGIDVAGSADVDVNRIDTADFAAAVSGSGDLRLPNLSAATARFSVAGSGTLNAAGASKTVRANVAGSGDVKIANLRAETLTASVSGSGNVEAFATTSASVSVAGSGNVRVRGGARCAIAKAGSGSVDCS